MHKSAHGYKKHQHLMLHDGREIQWCGVHIYYSRKNRGLDSFFLFLSASCVRMWLGLGDVCIRKVYELP